MVADHRGGGGAPAPGNGPADQDSSTDVRRATTRSSSAVDHRFLLVTSANFSWSAENGNLELGVLIDNPNLAEAVEHEMRQVEGFVFERVLVPG